MDGRKAARKAAGEKTRGQKILERRATAPERRRRMVAFRFRLHGDGDTEGYAWSTPPKGK